MPGVMTHSSARVIKQLVIDLGHGGEPLTVPLPSWPVYRGREPDRPDDVIAVKDTGGRDFGHTQVDGERQERHGIQIVVRAADYSEGYLKCREIALALDSLTMVPVTVNESEVGTGTDAVNYLVKSVERTTDVLPLGSDTPQGKRLLFTVNALCSIRQCS